MLFSCNVRWIVAPRIVKQGLSIAILEMAWPIWHWLSLLTDKYGSWHCWENTQWDSISRALFPTCQTCIWGVAQQPFLSWGLWYWVYFIYVLVTMLGTLISFQILSNSFLENIFFCGSWWLMLPVPWVLRFFPPYSIFPNSSVLAEPGNDRIRQSSLLSGSLGSSFSPYLELMLALRWVLG